jgi:hypothetical protein
MPQFKIFVLLLTMIPMLIIMLVSMPVALIGLLGKWAMDWSAKKVNEFSNEINDITKGA